MPLQEQAVIIEHKEVTRDFFMMVLNCPGITREAVPGQFVHVLISSEGSLDPLLRRPISIHEINLEAGTLSLLYQVVGRGTRALAKMQPGMNLDLMGPLGNGFNLEVPGEGKYLVIAGGIGVAPVLPVLQRLKDRGCDVTLLLGARNADSVLAREEIEKLNVAYQIATDDGSMGHRGFVTDLVNTALDGGKRPDYFYACGPEPMLKSVSGIMAKAEIPGQVSLEERMGCGVGACLACVCKIRIKEKDEWTYKKVCVDGPVFEAGEVAWHEQ